MAKVSTDRLADIVCNDDDETTAQRIEQIVDHVASALHQCVPDEAHSKHRALEAIAHKNVDLPDTIDAREFCKIVNQQIYQLRIGQQCALSVSGPLG